MKRYYIPFLIPFFAFISPAVAADVPETDSFAEPDVPTSTSFDWTGFYVGLQAGYEWHEGNYNDPIQPGAEGTYDLTVW